MSELTFASNSSRFREKISSRASSPNAVVNGWVLGVHGCDLALNASRLSADEILREIESAMGKVDVAMVAVDGDQSRDRSRLKLAVEALRERGRLTGLSSLVKVLKRGGDTQFLLEAYGKSLRLARSLENVYPSGRKERSRMQCQPFSRAVDWVRNGRLDLKALIAHRVGFDEIEKTLELCKLRPAQAIKAVTAPPQGYGHQRGRRKRWARRL